VGAGVAGLSCATTAASRGHAVTLFEKSDRIGGQFNLAAQIPGKAEFHETLRYFRRRLEVTGVTVRLGTAPDAALLNGFDEVVFASGVRPREVSVPGFDDPRVMTYAEAIEGRRPIGQQVLIIGAGGIGFDVATLLTAPPPATDPIAAFASRWGIDPSLTQRGGLVPEVAEVPAVQRQVTVLQRKASKPGDSLGRTTGWIHRTELKDRGVRLYAGVQYVALESDGLHVVRDGHAQVLPADTVIVCAGQESVLPVQANELSTPTHLIGGVRLAAELDAERAIRDGAELAARL
jgi:2,4-dienoyl-CoA reductase (NADPH2)